MDAEGTNIGIFGSFVGLCITTQNGEGYRFSHSWEQVFRLWAARLVVVSVQPQYAATMCMAGLLNTYRRGGASMGWNDCLRI